MRGAEWWEVLFGSLSFLTAGFSAHQWFVASRNKLPSLTGDDWEGRGPFANALAKQSALSARGISCVVCRSIPSTCNRRKGDGAARRRILIESHAATMLGAAGTV